MVRRLFRFELLKLKGNVLFWTVLGTCILAAAVLSLLRLYLPGPDGMREADYAPLYKELHVSFSETEGEEGDDFSLYVEGEADRREPDFETASDAEWMIWLRYHRILGHAKEVEGYASYRESLEEDVENRLGLSMLSPPGSFSQRRLLRVKEVYGSLEAGELKADFDHGVLAVLQNPISDCLLLMVVFLLVMQVFLSEFSGGTFPFLKRGAVELVRIIGVKLLTLLMLAASLTILFYAVQICAVYFTVGFGDPSRAIQSVQGHMASPYALKVWEYLLGFVGVRVLVMVAFSVFIAGLCVLLRQGLFVILLVAALGGAGALLYNGIPEYSVYAAFRQLNAAALMDTQKLFSDYLIVNVFGLAFSAQFCALLTGVFLAGAGVFMLLGGLRSEGVFADRVFRFSSVWLFLRLRPGAERRKRRRGGLAAYELRKMFFKNKGIYAILLTFGISCIAILSEPLFMTKDEYYYKEYCDKLKGLSFSEQEAYLLEEEERFLRLEEDLWMLGERLRKGELDQGGYDYLVNEIMWRLDKQAALNKVLGELEEVRMNGRLSVTYRTPYERLLGPFSAGRWLFLLACVHLMLILIASGAGAYEAESGVGTLIRMSSAGIKAVLGRKRRILFFAGFSVFLLIFVFRMIALGKVFGFVQPDLSLGSYTAAWPLMSRLPLGLCFGLLALCLALDIGIVSGLSLKASHTFKNRFAFLGIASGAFVIPLIMLYLRTSMF